MSDATELVRRSLVEQVNRDPGSREFLEHKHGQVWDTNQMREEFEVVGFMAPYVVARRNCDGVRGTLMFQHSPRFYFSFEPE